MRETLDLAWVRAQFPAFSEPSLAGQSFFENAGGSYACGAVIDRLTRFYRARKMQPYAPNAAATAGGAEMDEARARMAAILGVGADELSFGPSTTQNTYVLAQAFAQTLPEGAAIIVTNQDHEANSGPWRRLAERGIEVREWRIDPDTGHLNITALEALLDDKVALVCFPHCSNVVGEINDVRAIVNVIHAAGAVACVDGVSYAPHGFPDVGALNADIYLFSAYKTFGPHQGLMVVRRALADRLTNQGHAFNAYDPVKRFTPAGPDHAQVAACAGMADYVDAFVAHHGCGDTAGMNALVAAHEASLMRPLLEAMRARNAVRILGPQTPHNRAPTVALEIARDPEAVAADLAEHGIMTWGGDFYAGRALSAMGINLPKGVLRLSMAQYTGAEDVDKLLGALDRTL